jgi:methyl-accepting chemotaxis protein PixJ
MTADQSSPIPEPHLSHERPQGAVKRFNSAKIQGAIAGSATVALLLFGASTWNVWELYRSFQATIQREFKLQDLSSKIVYYDEVLTMSARMSASTADASWEKRYWDNEPALTNAIQEVEKLLPEIFQTQTSQTKNANEKLIKLEEKAFKLVQSGKSEEALALLLSPEYDSYKQIYTSGIEKTIQVIDEEIESLQTQYNRLLQRALIFSGVSLPLLIMSLIVVTGLIRTYLRDRVQAENALKISQASLLESNETLTDKIQMIEEQTQRLKLQEQRTAQESELLQNDIASVLDVLADLESGDFTVAAEVNDRVTGLVADTLNRLIEQLTATLSQVTETATITATSSNDVKLYAEQVASDIDEQTQGVNQMFELTETVWQSAHQAIEKIEDTQKILSEVKVSVNQGQGAINEMNQGIDVLQTGSDRMVQKIKTLGEFVSLADQFVQEQNQTASMTQVLALNASLVAAKAAEQRDPAQFQKVAREFESIANQVQRLAQQTNTGLESLHQRTTKIHGVVSDVDREVQGLNGLVSNFSQGVAKSTQAFSEVQTKTIQVEVSGQAVERGNTRIVQAAENTRTALQDIFTQATRTTERMQSTLSRSIEMRTIASKLIDSVRIFTLPQHQESLMTSEPVAESEVENLTQMNDFAPSAHPDINPPQELLLPHELGV